METTLAARPAGLARRAGRDAATFFLPGSMLAAASANCSPGLPPVLERLLRMQNAEIALYLLYGPQPLPGLPTLQVLRRYLAGEYLPPDQAVRCQQQLAEAQRHQA